MAKKNKTEKPVVFNCFYNWIIGRPHTGLPVDLNPFPDALRAYETDTPGLFHLVELKDNNTCVEYTENQLANKIHYASAKCADEFCLDSSQARSCARGITALLGIEVVAGTLPRLIPKPEIVVFKSDPRLAFCRLDFDPAEGICQNWDEAMGRNSNPEAIEAFIGALFDNDMSRAQYLYIQGEGNTGKSTIANFIRKIMDKGMHTTDSKTTKSEWFFSQIVNARLCYVTEASSTWPLSNEFKALTGDNHVVVNVKFKAPFATTISTRFMFVSNYKLQMDGLIENKRRALYSEMVPFQGEEKTERKALQDLMDEAPAIVWRCKMALDACRNGDKIRTKIDSLAELIAENEQWIENFIHDYFKLDKHGTIPARDFSKAINDRNLKLHEIRMVKGWLSKNGVNLDVRLGNGNSNGPRQRAYKGVAWNPKARGYARVNLETPMKLPIETLTSRIDKHPDAEVDF